jgi:hypothetical protein
MEQEKYEMSEVNLEDYLVHLNLEVNKKQLKKEMQSVNLLDSEQFSKNPYNTAWKKGVIPQFCTETYRIVSFLKNITNTDQINAVYYKQEANKEILPHRDTGCHTSLNIVLSEKYIPVRFENTLIDYNCALLNVGMFDHSVPAFSESRKVVRFVFKDKNLNYYLIKNKLKHLIKEG